MGKCIVPETSNDQTIAAVAIGPRVAFDKSYLTNSGASTVYVIEGEVTTGKDPEPIVPTCATVVGEGFPILPGAQIIKDSKFFGWGGFFAACASGSGELRFI